MNISARNTLKGKIKRISPGAVNTEVIIELATGIEVVSIITKESAERLDLAAGKRCLRGHQGERCDGGN